ncbi:helix-turn-helix domain-containing protein [Enterococcus faecalis]|uniref:helix-turn-helix domain-containing protein n=1 Tax=Enterococcus faecalis TaxID=1351 RepID=UPI0029C9A014|nr:helix-turn-helix transcriptional regulator [Enterococcus faecalis]WPH51296.1 helix-turn-helix transcriptional regulator [Enterococcus faecalis]
MTTFERIQELAKKRDKNLKEISIELGYSKNYLYTLKTKEPAADKLRNIANYFNVSVDYLLGRTENPNQAGAKPSDDLDEVLDNVMSFDGEPLDDHDREVIRAYLKGRFGK